MLNHMFISDEDVACHGYKSFHKLKQQMKMMKIYLLIFEAFTKCLFMLKMLKNIIIEKHDNVLNKQFC